jgi:2'-5' RNA ligase
VARVFGGARRCSSRAAGEGRLIRLFVALDVSDRVRRRAADLVDLLSRRLGTGVARVSWVPPDRLHLTLLFIGHVDAETAADVHGRLVQPFDAEPFTLRFGDLGVFPPSGRPRVVWVGIESGKADVHRVHLETVRRLEGVAFRREARPFSAHLTLGRFREPGPARLRRELLDLSVPTIGRCTIDAVTLYESRLSPRGPSYIALLRSALRGRS